MTDKLREFVYLDDVSINSHLASLGSAIPEEVVDTEEKITEKEGGGSIELLQGKYVSGDTSGTETTRTVTAPYRFENLISEMGKEEIDIHENPDVRSVERGDVVRIDGVINPLSVYLVETPVRSLLDQLAGLQEQAEDIEELAGRDSEAHGIDMDKDEVDSNQIADLIDFLDTFQDLAERFVGDSVPVRIDIDSSGPYVTYLDRNKFRKSHFREFSNSNRFVAFGKVMNVHRSEDWEPIQVSKTAENVASGKIQFADDIHDVVKDIGRELDISVDESDIVVPSPTAEIHTMAVYW